jgi:DNA-binding response OmpR family regulator
MRFDESLKTDLSSDRPVMSSEKILIVEDDADVLLGYRVFLRAHGYATVVATDGLFAVSEAVAHLPDLIILDLGLPGGDGFRVLDNYRAHPRLTATPIIVVSGRDPRANRDRALQAGAKAFVQKPWNDAVLLATINRLLAHPRDRAMPEPTWDRCAQ